MNQYSFLMDSNGELIYHPRHALVNSGIIEKPPETLAEYQDGFYETEIGKEQVFCSVKTVGYTGWKIIRVIGKEELRSYGIKSTFFVLAVICQVLLFFQVVGSYISMVLTRPICNLEEDVQRISAGELDIKVHTAGSFEVYHLGRSIQKMAVRIKKLMREVIQEQEAKRKSELDSLQAQITPHFLYNTLDIVVWMIEENRKEDAAGMVTALARFLRISLSKGKNIITVADELEHARNYLMIQSLRAKDQFTYRIEKDPGTECFQVIKLIVQPIVENALYHGLEGMYGDGEIVIHAYTKDGDLYISVKDNGMGMSKEQAEALLDYTKELKTAKGNGIGVRNVHERIQLHFGKEYGVQIISEEDEGTGNPAASSGNYVWRKERMRRAKKIGIVCVGILMIVFMFLSYSNLFGGETERDITKISVIGIKRKNSQVEDFKRGIEEDSKCKACGCRVSGVRGRL